MTGERFVGAYQVLEELGAGGMGTVHRGLDTRSQQIVAIKQLKSEISQPEMLERFRREGEALRDLNHPNIVKMLDALEYEGEQYLIIEYVAGGDLSTLLKNGRFTIRQTLEIALDLADALTRAHRLNIIHRDLKPANILIAADGTPRLTDFGVSHFGKRERVTQTGVAVGTLDYLSPEALNGDSTSAKTDIWAFGVILFEMLAGRRPFKGERISHLITAILNDPLPDLEVLCPDAPDALVDLIYRMLEREPHARIASVRHVGAALEDILHGRELQALSGARFGTPTPEVQQYPRHKLPAQITPFVGREHELEELARLINNPEVRLITILAPGGMGKTRLSLEAAERQFEQFASGVCLVELAPLADPQNILAATAEAVGYQFQADGREPKQQLLDSLYRKQMLLVMDNFEHLLDGADIVTEILRSAQQVKIIATSRQRLGQPGEILFHLHGIDFPEWETPADALNYAAVKLFMNSARRVRPDFELTTENLDHVARICRLVAGMPLGILLSAAWLAVLTAQEVAQEIQAGLDFLADEAGEMPERQRSIHMVFDYSWQLMATAEQQAFMALSIFRGGFTREAAETVAGANLRILMSLVNKSLLHRDTASGRYSIHELLRQYAHTKLVALPAVHKEYQDRHRAYFALFLEQRWNPLRSAQQHQIIDEIEADFDNIRAAWRIMVAEEQVDEIRKCLLCLWLFLFIGNRHEDGLELFEHNLTLTDQDDRVRTGTACNLQAAQAWFYIMAGQPAAGRAAALDCLKKLEHMPEHPDRILPNFTLAQAALSLAQYDEAEQAARENLMIARKTGDEWTVMTSLVYFGLVAISRSDYVNGMRYMDECLRLAQKSGDPFAQGAALRQIGGLAHVNQEYKKAVEIYQQALPFLEQSGQFYMMAFTRRSLSWSALQLGDYDEAKIHLRQSLILYQANGQVWEMLATLEDIANWFAIQGMKERAEELYMFVHEHTTGSQESRQRIAKKLSRLQTGPDHEHYLKAQERGKSPDLESVVQQLIAEFAVEG